MKNLKEKITLLALGAVYLVCSMRYFPGRLIKTGHETLYHMLSMAPLSIGATLVFVSLFRKMSGEKLPHDRAVRIFFTFAIILEFFLGLYHYLEINAVS